VIRLAHIDDELLPSADSTGQTQSAAVPRRRDLAEVVT